MVTQKYRGEQWTEDDRILLDLAQQLFRFFLTDEYGQALLSLLGVHTASCVIDTNVLLQDISRTLKKKQTTALVLAARIGTLRIYASTQVRDEVPEKLHARAQSLKIDPGEACRLWRTTYIPLIHFLDPGDLARDGEKIAALLQRDPDPRDAQRDAQFR